MEIYAKYFQHLLNKPLNNMELENKRQVQVVNNVNEEVQELG